MNKKIIAVAVAAGLALPMVTAQAADMETKGASVYGKLHVNLGQYDEDGSTKDNFRLQSFSSRLGFKGQQKLDEALAGTYKFESEIDVTGVATNKLSTRNTYLGLKGNFGEVRMGLHDSPLKMAQGKFDQFGDTDGDFKNATHADQDGEDRNKNSITYLGKFGNVGVNVQLIPTEGDGSTGGQGVADTISAAVSYKSGPMYIALAQNSYDNKAGAAESSQTRLAATYKISDMQIGAFYQTGVEAPTTSAAKENWVGLSFNMKLGSKNKLKAQYITVKDNAATVNTANQLSVGLDRKVGKKGTVYAMYNSVDRTDNTKDKSSVSAGYILKF